MYNFKLFMYSFIYELQYLLVYLEFISRLEKRKCILQWQNLKFSNFIYTNRFLSVLRKCLFISPTLLHDIAQNSEKAEKFILIKQENWSFWPHVCKKEMWMQEMTSKLNEKKKKSIEFKKKKNQSKKPF